MVVGAASRTEDYKNRVLTLDHAGILRLWGALCRGTRLRGWPPGRALEYLLLRAFQLEGAEVTWPYHVHGMFPPANVLFWRGAEIDRALQKRWLCKGMEMKLRYAKEHGIASMDLIEKRILT